MYIITLRDELAKTSKEFQKKGDIWHRNDFRLNLDYRLYISLILFEKYAKKILHHASSIILHFSTNNGRNFGLLFSSISPLALAL